MQCAMPNCGVSPQAISELLSLLPRNGTPPPEALSRLRDACLTLAVQCSAALETNRLLLIPPDITVTILSMLDAHSFMQAVHSSRGLQRSPMARKAEQLIACRHSPQLAALRPSVHPLGSRLHWLQGLREEAEGWHNASIYDPYDWPSESSPVLTEMAESNMAIVITSSTLPARPQEEDAEEDEDMHGRRLALVEKAIKASKIRLLAGEWLHQQLVRQEGLTADQRERTRAVARRLINAETPQCSRLDDRLIPLAVLLLEMDRRSSSLVSDVIRATTPAGGQQPTSQNTLEMYGEVTHQLWLSLCSWLPDPNIPDYYTAKAAAAMLRVKIANNKWQEVAQVIGQLWSHWRGVTCKRHRWQDDTIATVHLTTFLAGVWRQLVGYLHTRGSFDLAADQLGRLIELTISDLPTDQLDLARLYSELADLTDKLGQHKEHEEHLRSALGQFEQLSRTTQLSGNWRTDVQLLNIRLLSVVRARNHKEDEHLVIAELLAHHLDTLTSACYHEPFRAHESDGCRESREQLEACGVECQEALRELQRRRVCEHTIAHGDGHAVTLRSVCLLANLERVCGDTRECCRLLEQAVDGYGETAYEGEEDQNILTEPCKETDGCMVAAALLHLLREASKSDPQLVSRLHTQQLRFGEAQERIAPDIPLSYLHRLEVHRARGEGEAASSLCARMVALAREACGKEAAQELVVPSDPPWLMETLRACAAELLILGRRAESIGMLEEALTLGVPTAQMLTRRYQCSDLLVLALEKEGRHVEAASLHRKTMDACAGSMLSEFDRRRLLVRQRRVCIVLLASQSLVFVIEQMERHCLDGPEPDKNATLQCAQLVSDMNAMLQQVWKGASVNEREEWISTGVQVERRLSLWADLDSIGNDDHDRMALLCERDDTLQERPTKQQKRC